MWGNYQPSPPAEVHVTHNSCLSGLITGSSQLCTEGCPKEDVQMAMMPSQSVQFLEQ